MFTRIGSPHNMAATRVLHGGVVALTTLQAEHHWPPLPATLPSDPSLGRDIFEGGSHIPVFHGIHAIGLRSC